MDTFDVYLEFYWYQGDLKTPKDEDAESSSDDGSDSGEEQQKMLKEVKFPETEKEKHPHQCSQQISRCIAKRVEKLAEEITKLEAITNKTDLQSKLLDLIVRMYSPVFVLHQRCLWGHVP